MVVFYVEGLGGVGKWYLFVRCVFLLLFFLTKRSNQTALYIQHSGDKEN